jgi:hypothetical protein
MSRSRARPRLWRGGQQGSESSKAERARRQDQRPGNDTLCRYEPLVSVSLIDPAAVAACGSEDDLLG